MYNGIGLPTPRGSGTNGFVQRNLAHVKKSRQYKHDIVSKPDPNINKPQCHEIVMHQKKREIEAKCLKLREELEDEGWNNETIDREIIRYRAKKLEELSKMTGTEDVDKLKRSFGIKDKGQPKQEEQEKQPKEERESKRVKLEKEPKQEQDAK